MQDTAHAPNAECVLRPSSPMVNATIVAMAENRHTALRRPLDALKIKNYRALTTTELVDVQAAAGILTGDILTLRVTPTPP